MSETNYKDNAQQIISEFEMFSDWMDKYNYIIELGKSIPLIDEKYKTENYLISGCQSQVWLFAEYKDGRVFFTADSDAIITKGIVNILIRVMSGLPTEEIINADLEFIDKTGLREHLSPTRSNGLNAMIKQMKLYALVFKTKFETNG
jgi:cysteine desulfuration protein SufE